MELPNHSIVMGRCHVWYTKELGVLKGQLSRWLLPFNADTSVEQQQAVTPRRVKESLMASSTTSAGGGVGALSEKEAQYLTNSARKLRQLVRQSKSGIAVTHD